MDDLLYPRDYLTLEKRLEAVDANQRYEDGLLPIELILRQLFYYGRMGKKDVVKYYEEVIFALAEKTTPTKELIEKFCHTLMVPCAIRVLDELLKRYNGEKISFIASSKEMEMLLGYSLLDLETLVDYRFLRTPYMGTTAEMVLPIEKMIIRYALLGNPFNKDVLLDSVSLLKRYGSPPPDLDRLYRVIETAQHEEQVLSRMQEALAI